MPMGDLATSIPRKNCKTPKSLILNLSCKQSLIATMLVMELLARIMSSTYTRRAVKEVLVDMVTRL